MDNILFSLGTVAVSALSRAGVVRVFFISLWALGGVVVGFGCFFLRLFTQQLLTSLGPENPQNRPTADHLVFTGHATRHFLQSFLQIIHLAVAKLPVYFQVLQYPRDP